jgi:tetratricopeptide (TPR) repeat protein
VRDRSDSRTLVIVVLAALVAWAVALHGSFVNWDDGWLILENPHLRSSHHIERVLDPFADRALLGAEYLPLRDLSNMADYAFFELEPTGYRLGNWLLHALAAGAAFLLLRELTDRRPAAFAGALLWAVHPLHAEVVAWASARKDLLNAVFALLAATFLLRGARTGRRIWEWAALLSFTLATLSKTSAAALPVAIALAEVMRGNAEVPLARRWGRALLRAAPLLLVAAAGAMLNGWHQSRNWVQADWRGSGPLEHFLIVAGVQGRSLVQAVLPFGLGPDYPALAEDATRTWNFVSLGIVAAAMAATLILLRRRPREGVLAAWWFIVMVPVANVLVPITNISADRYLFLPLLGLCALAGCALAALDSRRAATGVLVAVTAALSVLSVRQALFWKDSLALWTRAVEVAPRSGRAWQNLGDARHFHEAPPEQVLEAYRRMVEVEPDNASLWVHLGNRLWDLEGSKKAADVEAYLKRAVDRAKPDQGGPFVALAWIVNQRGRQDEAVALLHEAVRRQPLLAEARLNLGRWHHAEERWARAAEEMEEALRIGLPLNDAIEAHDTLHEVYRAMGDDAAAKRHRNERERKRALTRGE